MADPTTTYSLSAPFRFDIESAAFKANPYPTFAAMRAAGPVIPMKFPIIGRTWITTTHASTSAMVKDNETFVQEAPPRRQDGRRRHALVDAGLVPPDGQHHAVEG